MVIVKFPDPSLDIECKPVTVFGPELKTLLESMYETMINATGIGLAANQVSLPYRMLVMTGPDKEKLFLINPEITEMSLSPANLKEGCLSSPGEFFVVPSRPAWTTVTYQDEVGKSHQKVFVGIYSVCVNHEIDHLDGLSYLEEPSVPRAKRKELAKKWKRKK